MEVINPIPQLEADLNAASNQVAMLTDNLQQARDMYAPPALTLYTNNGAGYEIGVAPPSVPHNGNLIVTHTPFGGTESTVISLNGSEQLTIGEVKAQWLMPDATTSEIAVLAIS